MQDNNTLDKLKHLCDVKNIDSVVIGLGISSMQMSLISNDINYNTARKVICFPSKELKNELTTTIYRHAKYGLIVHCRKYKSIFVETQKLKSLNEIIAKY